jgi:23S rRNA pseudouridine2457 synthase
MVIILNKPFGALCQFSGGEGRPTLKDFVRVPGIYPAGRLDADSEGLVALTDVGELQHQISHPKGKWPKTYWVQVEGIPTTQALVALRSGIDLGDFASRTAKVRVIPEPPGLWERQPPIRIRRRIPTSWLEITLREGRNRQIRRMTAAVGLPTLRLIRYAIGHWTTDGLPPGSYRSLSAAEVDAGRPERRL